MKQKTKHAAMILAIIGITTAGLSIYLHNQNQPQKLPVKVDYFSEGDTLYPCDFCPDTLIVVDAVGFNKAMQIYDTSLSEMSDIWLDSAAHSNCRQLRTGNEPVKPTAEPETAGESDSTPQQIILIH